MNDMVTDSMSAATSIIFLGILLVYSPITDVLFTIIITARNTSGTTMALSPHQQQEFEQSGKSPQRRQHCRDDNAGDHRSPEPFIFLCVVPIEGEHQKSCAIIASTGEKCGLDGVRKQEYDL